MAAEAKGVVGDGVDFHLAGLVGYVVEVAVRVGGLVVDGRRDGAGFERLAAGGPTPPAAPSMCPVAPLVELTARRRACSPNTDLMAWVSQTSPCGVEVPWALM